jgi:hypothetical protein
MVAIEDVKAFRQWLSLNEEEMGLTEKKINVN